MEAPKLLGNDTATLEQRIEALEKQTASRNKDLADATAELEGFIYAVSHDLRAPLRSILASCMILSEDHAGQIDEIGRDELKRQAEAAKRLNGMLEELLQLSRLSRQEMKLEPVEFGGLALEVARSLRAEEALEVEPDIIAVADGPLLKLALHNLIDNSVKFARKDEPLKITVGRREERFFVKDNGRGFDMKRAGRIFLPFERLNGEEFPGSGMGLTTVKRIVDRHHGRIEAEGAPGQGATFWFTLGAQ